MDAFIQNLRDLVVRGGFGWNNFLDIAIIAIFIYWVLMLIRGTRAVQLLFGVLVILGIWGIAAALKLTVTLFLLDRLALVALIAIPVIFQPELRRALGQIGRIGSLNRLLAPPSEGEVEHIVEELVRATTIIRQQKHGALVVIERGTGLQDYGETGVPINGRLTAELLASIFFRHSPLHDGAVILRGDQIVAAACLLPIEETPSPATHRYGMRHRAALSISGQTDAVVVVVSEESGSVSVAHNGRIIGGLDEERLRRVLGSLLRSRVQPLPFRKVG
jgi:diadenylate cyclase